MRLWILFFSPAPFFLVLLLDGDSRQIKFAMAVPAGCLHITVPAMVFLSPLAALKNFGVALLFLSVSLALK